MIRTATVGDLDIVAEVESICFPPEEACSRESFKARLDSYSNHFWLLFDDKGKLISFIDGFCTNLKDLTDDMYEKPDMHDENGVWQMIFGVNTLPDYRKQGNASKLMQRVIDDCKTQKRAGMVLTCKQEKIPFYQRFGFTSEGLSESSHGSATWYQMRLEFYH